MADLLCDTNVVVVWFRSEQGRDADAARALLAAHETGRLRAYVLDLTYYETANVLARHHRVDGAEVADALDQLETICGPGIPQSASQRSHAARIADLHGLTFYDASYVAAARSLGMRLATGDRAIVQAGGGERPSAIADDLGLRF